MSPKEVKFPPLYRLLKVDVAPQNRLTFQLPNRLGLEGYFDTFNDKNNLSYNVPVGSSTYDNDSFDFLT